MALPRTIGDTKALPRLKPHSKTHIPAKLESLELLSRSLAADAKEFIATKAPKYEIAFNTWLKVRSVINMYAVCWSFHNKRLHYSLSQESPQTHQLDDGSTALYWPNDFATSLPSLQQVFIQPNKNQRETTEAFPLYFTFRVTPGHNPAHALQELPFSLTRMDCGTAATLAHSLATDDSIGLFPRADAIRSKIYGKGRPDDQRLTMGRATTKNFLLASEMHPPAEYFTKSIESISMDDLIKNPWKFMGTILYIPGAPNYTKLHPHGSSRGFNVIFCGLSEKNEPLFLAAMGPGEPFMLTFSAIQKYLVKNYNLLPEFSVYKKLSTDAAERKTPITEALQMTTLKALPKMDNAGTTLDPTRLLELQEPATLLEKLGELSTLYKISIRLFEGVKADCHLVSDAKTIRTLQKNFKIPTPRSVVKKLRGPRDAVDDCDLTTPSRPSLRRTQSMVLFPRTTLQIEEIRQLPQAMTCENYLKIRAIIGENKPEPTLVNLPLGKTGFTILVLAACFDNSDYINKLLLAGAKITEKNSKDETVLQVLYKIKQNGVKRKLPPEFLANLDANMAFLTEATKQAEARNCHLAVPR